MQFDWTRILKGQSDPEPPRVSERRVTRPGGDRQGGRSGPERRAIERPERRNEPASRLPATPAPERAAAARAAEPAPQADEPVTAAHARLGSEGLARLRARYAEARARIAERVPDAERQTQLKTLAERLNPDGWVTEGEVSAGLESYEATFEALRGSIGTRRRDPSPAGADVPGPTLSGGN